MFLTHNIATIIAQTGDLKSQRKWSFLIIPKLLKYYVSSEKEDMKLLFKLPIYKYTAYKSIGLLLEGTIPLSLDN